MKINLHIRLLSFYKQIENKLLQFNDSMKEF